MLNSSGSKPLVVIMLFCLLFAACSTFPENTPTPTITPVPSLTPLPTFENAEFPTGIFSSNVPGVDAYEFYQDGTMIVRNPGIIGVTCVYGVNGNLFAAMKTNAGSSHRQVPATYYWHFDGNQLTFQVWGEELHWMRGHEMNGQVFTLTSEILPTLETEIEQIQFPTGRFLLDSPTYYAIEFNKNGNWYGYETEGGSHTVSGKYATTGNLYQEMTHDYPDSPHVPATYYWNFDGQTLTFELWGDDVIQRRKDLFDGQKYIITD